MGLAAPPRLKLSYCLVKGPYRGTGLLLPECRFSNGSLAEKLANPFAADRLQEVALAAIVETANPDAKKVPSFCVSAQKLGTFFCAADSST